MSNRLLRHASIVGASLIAFSSSNAFAQYFPAGDPCACAQPVVQSCYQTVPVTEYHQVKQTVQAPEYYTEYEDRQVTEYVPTTVQRTAEVPTVSYQNVTEYQCMQRDMGQWVTRTECVNKMAPCQYDNRPGLLGWFNRTGYSMRSAFTPNYRTHREYVPNVVAQMVPVTRQVAQHGVRQVVYNETKLVPQTRTQQVAVQKVRYVAREITTTEPRVAYRTVPIGTSLAYAYGSPFISSAPTATALRPEPDPISRSAKVPRRAERERTTKKPDHDHKSGQIDPAGKRTNRHELHNNEVQPPKMLVGQNETKTSRPVPSVVRASGWVSRRAAEEQQPAGPSLIDPNLVVSNQR